MSILAQSGSSLYDKLPQLKTKQEVKPKLDEKEADRLFFSAYVAIANLMKCKFSRMDWRWDNEYKELKTAINNFVQKSTNEMSPTLFQFYKETYSEIYSSFTNFEKQLMVAIKEKDVKEIEYKPFDFKEGVYEAQETATGNINTYIIIKNGKSWQVISANSSGIVMKVKDMLNSHQFYRIDDIKRY